MNRPANSLLAAALSLPDSERADLAARLIDSLDSDGDDGCQEVWADEIRRRLDELDRGQVRPITSDEATQLLRGPGDAPIAG